MSVLLVSNNLINSPESRKDVVHVSSFPDRLRDARKAIGWTGDEAAEKAEVVRATIYNWEAGKGSPGDTYLRALCGRGISPEWLLTNRGDMWAMEPDEAKQRLQLVRVALDSDDVGALVELLEGLDPGDET